MCEEDIIQVGADAVSFDNRPPSSFTILSNNLVGSQGNLTSNLVRPNGGTFGSATMKSAIMGVTPAAAEGSGVKQSQTQKSINKSLAKLE